MASPPMRLLRAVLVALRQLHEGESLGRAVDEEPARSVHQREVAGIGGHGIIRPQLWSASSKLGPFGIGIGPTQNENVMYLIA